MFTLNDLFDIAARLEQNGRAIYTRAGETSGDKDLGDLLQWMADEEASHSTWFLDQKERLAREGQDLETILPDVIREMMGENSLSLDEVDFSRITTPVQMLKTFIMFENDTILFYEFLDTFIESPQARQGLKKIIKEETDHVEKLTAMIHSFEPPEDPSIEG